MYSIGSHKDFPFERGMKQKMGVVDMGDYEKDMPKQLKLLTFLKMGKKQDRHLTELPNPGLKDTVNMLGHENENVGAIDIFKIDCEG